MESATVSAEHGGEVLPGAPVVIEVVVAVAEPLDGVACGIEIGRGDLFPIATLLGGYDIDPFTLMPPRVTLRCRIDRLPLAPGTYQLRVGLKMQSTGATLATHGYEDAATALTVASAADRLTNVVRDRQNLVQVDSDWVVTHDHANLRQPADPADIGSPPLTEGRP